MCEIYPNEQKKLKSGDFLDRAIKVAVNAHMGKFDENGRPRVLKNMRMMGMLEHDMELASIAVMFDVLEYSWYNYKNLEQTGFSKRILDGVEALTRKQGQSFDAYMEQVCSNIDAARVKLYEVEYEYLELIADGISPACTPQIDQLGEEMKKLEKVLEA